MPAGTLPCHVRREIRRLWMRREYPDRGRDRRSGTDQCRPVTVAVVSDRHDLVRGADLFRCPERRVDAERVHVNTFGEIRSSSKELLELARSVEHCVHPPQRPARGHATRRAPWVVDEPCHDSHERNADESCSAPHCERHCRTGRRRDDDIGAREVAPQTSRPSERSRRQVRWENAPRRKVVDRTTCDARRPR